MKIVLAIRRLLRVTNLVLLAILVYIIVGFIPGDYAEQSTFVDSTPMEEKGEIIPFENPLLPNKHKIIVERNIFGSSELSPASENPRREKTEAPARTIRSQLRLLATVAGDDQVACAVIENIKSKVQDIYKAGDIIEGVQIERIERNKVVVLYREQREVLSLNIMSKVLDPVDKKEEPVMAQKQNATESLNVVSAFDREINKRTFITQVPGIEVFLEKMEVAPYIVNGQQEGLSITGLDDLSMAGYFGFENGDVIQTINGQMLTDKQKAFQVLKKARAQSSLHFQLLRNQHKMDLSFEIN
ncbi:MAG: type II secretion system protein N [Planctomycetota bacterium]|jgi:type II secretion system protein C